ncbi:hydroxyacid dehydrogenase [Streptomyces mutabilis]|uniref:hydroxyacid dehydrogenase n=1 Tax=Streptomyces mutabilis TaxID=67332 RepID=UPI00365AADB4
MRQAITPVRPGSRARPPWAVASVLGPQWAQSVLTDRARTVIRTRAELLDPGQAHVSQHACVRVLITGWGTEPLTADVLDRFPSLELVLHAAGTVHGIVTDDVWERGIRVSTAASANAVAVADFTLAQIHLSVKNMWRLSLCARAARGPVPRAGIRGLDGAAVGLLGLGHIGRLVARRLSVHDLRVLAHDPYADDEHAAELGLRLTDIETVVATSDVLSLHAPLNDSTRHMLSESLLDLMPPDATLINTARGALIDQDGLTRFLTRRNDVFALLDVTEPEELPPGHPLFHLPNVLISPHIAGSLGSEVARLGDLVAAELVRFADGDTLQHELTQDVLARTA